MNFIGALHNEFMCDAFFITKISTPLYKIPEGAGIDQKVLTEFKWKTVNRKLSGI